MYVALFNGGYRVVFSYLVQYCGDNDIGQLGGVWPVHIVAEYAVICSKGQPDNGLITGRNM
jgi:hypothetical protein